MEGKYNLKGVPISLYTDIRIRPFELYRQSHLVLVPKGTIVLAVAAIIYYGLVPHRRDPMLPLPVTKVGLPCFGRLCLTRSSLVSYPAILVLGAELTKPSESRS